MKLTAISKIGRQFLVFRGKKMGGDIAELDDDDD